MKYVALLRGINVGGNNKVEMSRLKKVFETLGCKDVTTFINSGNVLFNDDRTSSDLHILVEMRFKKNLSYRSQLLLLAAK